jgi:hypothetical protein
MVHYRLEFDKVDLRGLKFLGFPVESARFIACKWPRSNGRNVIYDARRIEGKGYFELSNLDDNIAMEPHEIAPDPSHLEDLFRRLKKIAQDERDDLLASDFHYAEKEMQREVLRTAEEGFGLSPLVANLKALPGQVKQALQCTCGEGPHLVNLQYWNNLFLFVVVSIYRTSSGYGEIPLRAFCWLMTLIGLPLLFSDYPLYYIPLAKVGLDPEITVWQGVFITFWQILITLQAGLFAFALRNKFKR